MAGAMRVLVVEDDEDNGEVMAEVLADAGYEVLRARTGGEALRLLAAGDVDALLTDVGLPVVDGLEVARAVKARAPALPVVVVTGWAEREDVLRARGGAVDAVLVKPIEPEALLAAVERALRQAGRA